MVLRNLNEIPPNKYSYAITPLKMYNLIKSKGGVRDSTHSHQAPSSPGDGQKCRGKSKNVDELFGSLRKGQNHRFDCGMASDCCYVSLFLRSSCTRASLMAHSSSLIIRLNSLSYWTSTNPLKYITPSLMDSIHPAI